MPPHRSPSLPLLLAAHLPSLVLLAAHLPSLVLLAGHLTSLVLLAAHLPSLVLVAAHLPSLVLLVDLGCPSTQASLCLFLLKDSDVRLREGKGGKEGRGMEGGIEEWREGQRDGRADTWTLTLTNRQRCVHTHTGRMNGLSHELLLHFRSGRAYSSSCVADASLASLSRIRQSTLRVSPALKERQPLVLLYLLPSSHLHVEFSGGWCGM